jgi:large subunit ribosomal protein L25
MERIKIQSNIREKVGKERAKKERRMGEIPAIIYGKGENLSVTIPIPSLKTLKGAHFSRSAIIDMEAVGKEKKETISVLIKDIQYHPLSEEVIHMDFMRVLLTEKIRVNVPLLLKGEAKGVKEEGIVQQILWELEVEGLPLDIPAKIEVDVAELGIGDSIHVNEVKVPDKIKIVAHLEGTVVTVVEKAEEEEIVPTAAEVAPMGPEVIKEKKEGEEGEEGEETKEGADKEKGASEKGKEKAPEKGKEKAPERGKPEKGK